MKRTRRKTSKVWNYSHEELQKLIDESNTISNLCQKIGIDPRNGSVKSLYSRFKEEKFDFSTLENNRKLNGTNRIEKISLKDFCVNSSRNRNAIKRFIIKKNLIEYKCSSCSNDGEWNGKLLNLQLEHINGINDDNRLENLCFLCPNCHSQTTTFAGKNRKFDEKNLCFKQKKQIKIYLETQEEKLKRIKKSRKFDPSKEELEYLILSGLPMTKIGQKFNVSGNAIRKRCKLLNIDMKHGSQV